MNLLTLFYSYNFSPFSANHSRFICLISASILSCVTYLIVWHSLLFPRMWFLTCLAFAIWWLLQLTVYSYHWTQKLQEISVGIPVCCGHALLCGPMCDTLSWSWELVPTDSTVTKFFAWWEANGIRIPTWPYRNFSFHFSRSFPASSCWSRIDPDMRVNLQIHNVDWKWFLS